MTPEIKKKGASVMTQRFPFGIVGITGHRKFCRVGSIGLKQVKQITEFTSYQNAC